MISGNWYFINVNVRHRKQEKAFPLKSFDDYDL